MIVTVGIAIAVLVAWIWFARQVALERRRERVLRECMERMRESVARMAAAMERMGSASAKASTSMRKFGDAWTSAFHES